MTSNLGNISTAFVLEVGGVRVQIETDSPLVMGRLRNGYSTYEGKGVAHGFLSIKEMPGTLEEWDAQFVRNESLLKTPRLDAQVDEVGKGQAQVYLEDDQVLHELLGWFVPKVLLKEKIFLLKAAGVIREGKGYVLFGDGSCGKSTALALIGNEDSQAAVLGDEVIAVQWSQQGGVHLHTIPFGGSFRKISPPRASAPVQGLFHLRPASEMKIFDLPSGQAMEALLGSLLEPPHGSEAESYFELAGRIEKEVGVRRVDFPPESHFWFQVLGIEAPSRTFERSAEVLE